MVPCKVPFVFPPKLACKIAVIFPELIIIIIIKIQRKLFFNIKYFSCWCRGDSAFCSLECRQQQMTQDEKKDTCSVAIKKEAATTAAVPQVSATGERVAAV